MDAAGISVNPVISAAVEAHLALLNAVRQGLLDDINTAADMLLRAAVARKHIFWAGNGGSAADSQHLAAELIGRFKRERRSIASVALTTDSSVLTSIGNDYGFEDVFARQLSGLAAAGDVLVAISTSGNSRNLVQALHTARELGVSSIGLLGREGGAMKPLCSHSIVVPSQDTARIQEMHIMIGHILCDAIETAVAGGG